MAFKNFKDIIESVQKSPVMKKAAVVVAQDEHTIEAVFKASKDKIIEPVLIGDKMKIREIMEHLELKADDIMIIHTDTDGEAARKAVELINEKMADFIMKGKIQTADLLTAVVNKEKGLRTERLMSHIAIYEIPVYHKLLAVTDGGMLMYPSLEEKKQIIVNAVSAFEALGYKKPKVAVLAAVENINLKMPETVDADKLKKMFIQEGSKDCVIEGPISYDLAVSRESAKLKGFVSPVAGDADILIVPNIAAGNILGKALSCSAGARMAGFILGAKAPIVLTSRGASSEEKYLSLVLSAAASGYS